MDKSCSTAKEIAAKVALVYGRQKCESWLKLYSKLRGNNRETSTRTTARNKQWRNQCSWNSSLCLFEGNTSVVSVGVEVVAGNKLDQHSRVHFA